LQLFLNHRGVVKMSIQFTPQQAKTARVIAQLSQGRVASDIGINRSYLSQFESGKYLFDDATLTRLRDYYSKYGAKPELVRHTPSEFDNDIEEENTLRLRDGFLLPQEFDEDHADALLSEYAQNRRRIEDICNIELSNSGFLGFGLDEDKGNKRADEVLNLMARNYTIVEELQGHGIIHGSRKKSSRDEKKTVRDFVRLRLMPFIATPAITEG
jgi:transcriptional regulator with XRE-family HTH domain